MRSGGEMPPPERAVKSWYGYGALAEEEEPTASSSPVQLEGALHALCTHVQCTSIKLNVYTK